MATSAIFASVTAHGSYTAKQGEIKPTQAIPPAQVTPSDEEDFHDYSAP